MSSTFKLDARIIAHMDLVIMQIRFTWLDETRILETSRFWTEDKSRIWKSHKCEKSDALIENENRVEILNMRDGAKWSIKEVHGLKREQRNFCETRPLTADNSSTSSYGYTKTFQIDPAKYSEISFIFLNKQAAVWRGGCVVWDEMRNKRHTLESDTSQMFVVTVPSHDKTCYSLFNALVC